MRAPVPAFVALLLAMPTTACDSCFGPVISLQHVRHVRRMQPGAPNATYGPSNPLEWGQLNVLHTTDSHGWLEGHLKEQNYGADFGDFISFAKHMKAQAKQLGTDLLLIDTGDLHDGTGLSDTTTPDGLLTNKLFEELDTYDLLTIGNHELYLADVAYDTFRNFSRAWGDRYLTSNVQILDTTTNTWQYIGTTHRYFTTEQGLRIMAFGVLYDFTGNTNVTKVIHAKTMVQEDWFQAAIKNSQDPVDLFLLIGHNIARPSTGGSTFKTVVNAIRAVNPDTPIQIFGGHSHIRDFAVVDPASTALESGRFCETVGWLAMSGFDSAAGGGQYRGPGGNGPTGVPHPTRKAIKRSSKSTNSTAPWVYARRYLDWNRMTFAYHAAQPAFDTPAGVAATAEITADRSAQRLGDVVGCVPEAYCQSCVPFGSPKSLFTVLTQALSTVVVRTDRASTPRVIYANTGSVRFDMYKGPFTYDDNFVISPFRDVLLYIPDVPYTETGDLLSQLNHGGADKRHAHVLPRDLFGGDACVNPSAAAPIVRRQVQLTAGYTTNDDFGTDGDDTTHTSIPHNAVPDYFMANASFPASGMPDKVDVIFFDFIEPYILSYLGTHYNASMVTPYISENFTAQDYLLPFVKKAWGAGVPNCPL